jgi:hypothetical protein
MTGTTEALHVSGFLFLRCGFETRIADEASHLVGDTSNPGRMKS